MPPKQAAQTKESVDEAISRLIGSGDSPAEADFKIILNAAKGDEQQKKAAASYIPVYAEKFPKQQKAAVSAILDLAKCEDKEVRTIAVRNLKNFYEADPAQIGDALINSLSDSVEQIAKNASEYVERFLDSNDEFKTRFFNSLPNAAPLGQFRMVEIIREKIKFTEENIEQLKEVIKVAFKSCVVEGLTLYRNNRKIINEEEFQPIVEDLLKRLNESLQSDFKDVSENLLIPIFKFTKALGNNATTTILNIIAERVLPNFEELSSDKKIEVLRKIASVPQFAENDKLLIALYNNVFLKFPTEYSGNINMSIIEAALWAFMGLARRFNSTTSKLIGTQICYTGQPGEADDANENEEKYAEFRKRLEYLSTAAPNFVDQCDAEIQKERNNETSSPEEKSEKIKKSITAKKTGNNIRHLTRLLLSNNPLNGKLPESPSWKKAKTDRKFNTNRRGQRNTRNRGDRFNNRNSNRRNNSSRNGSRFNNNNRQRRGGRFNNRNRP